MMFVVAVGLACAIVNAGIFVVLRRSKRAQHAFFFVRKDR